MKSNIDNIDFKNKNKILRKLNALSRREIRIPEFKEYFVNLSSYQLSNDEIEFLNLGLNCHLEKKYNKVKKKVEIECLYQSLLKLQDDDKIEIHHNLPDELRRESNISRYKKSKPILNEKLDNAAKKLRENPNIVIRKADKSQIYVILYKEHYLNKLNNILNDESKFEKLTRNPVDALKTKANKIIEANNAYSTSEKLQKIIGDYILALYLC